MSERKQQILQAAVDIITNEGYGNLSMRALARASGLKLGALQYHFKTRDDMLRGVVAYIADEYKKNFDSVAGSENLVTLVEILEMLATEPADGKLQEDKLFPQLWAMMQAEPLVENLLNELYSEYLQLIEQALKGIGSKHPRAEALCLMSMSEGSAIFTGRGRLWEAEQEALFKTAIELLEAKYGDKIYTYKFTPNNITISLAS